MSIMEDAVSKTKVNLFLKEAKEYSKKINRHSIYFNQFYPAKLKGKMFKKEAVAALYVLNTKSSSGIKMESSLPGLGLVFTVTLTKKDLPSTSQINKLDIVKLKKLAKEYYELEKKSKEETKRRNLHPAVSIFPYDNKLRNVQINIYNILVPYWNARLYNKITSNKYFTKKELNAIENSYDSVGERAYESRYG